MSTAGWVLSALGYVALWAAAVALKTRSDVKYAKAFFKAGVPRKDIRKDLGSQFAMSFWMFSVLPLAAVLAVFIYPGILITDYLDRKADEIYRAVNPPVDLRESEHGKEIGS